VPMHGAARDPEPVGDLHLGQVQVEAEDDN
jgi:hypothetical protein